MSTNYVCTVITRQHKNGNYFYYVGEEGWSSMSHLAQQFDKNNPQQLSKLIAALNYFSKEYPNDRIYPSDLSYNPCN